MSKHDKAQMYIDIVALHKEVTGSLILCTVKFPDKTTTKFIVDCGLFQEEKYMSLNYSFPFNPRDIDFAIITHTHIDHIGRLPKLYKDGFKGKTYTSSLAASLMPIALNNTAQIFSNRSKISKKKLLVDSSIPIYDTSKSLYELADVEYAMQNVIAKEYNMSFSPSNHIAVTLLKNGHTLGSSLVFVTITYKGQEPIYLLFSGDYQKDNNFFKTDSIPKSLLTLPVNLITEATYGATSKKTIKPMLKDIVLKSMQNNETLIITVFAFGRMQEVKKFLKDMQDENLLSKDIKIYSDGRLAHEYDAFYLAHKEDLTVTDFIPKGVQIVSSYKLRDDLLKNRQRKIILTTSGMGSYGPAQVYLPYYISKPKCTIVFGGYTAQNTLGRKLQEVSENQVFELNGILTKKKAKVFSINEFSSHAKQEELLEFMSNFKNLKSVLINHAEKDIKEKFARKVLTEIAPKNVGLLDPKNCIRIGAYGIIKSFKTNFDYYTE